MAREPLDDDVVLAIRNVLEYNWGDELRDYLENGGDDHIFLSLTVLRKWLDKEAAR